MNKEKLGAIIIEGHVQGLSNTRSLGAAAVPVIVLDKGDCVARHSRYCSGFFRCPDYDTDALADFLIHLAEAHNLKDWLLLPSNDHAVHTLSRNKDRLQDYFKIITPDIDIIENIYDKSRLLALAQSLGVPIPDTFYAQNTSPADVPLGFPVLTRGRFGLDFYKATGCKAFLAYDEEQLHRQLIRIDAAFPVENTLTQSLIPDDGINKTISFAAFCVEGEIKAYWMGEKIREHPVRFGTATLAKSMFAKPCLDQSVKLLKGLNYTGVCEVEYMRDPRDGQYKLIEINARTWLWVGLAIDCGINFPLYIYNYVHNIRTEYPTEYEKGLYWRNFWTDMIYSVKYMIQGHLSYSDYRESLKSKMVYAVKSKSDPAPFRKMLTLLLLRWRSR